jgi:Protein of unknown function (DUF3017)
VRHAASSSAGHRRKRDKPAGRRPPSGRPASGPPASLPPAGPRAEGDEADPAAGRAGASARRRLAELLPYLIVICGTGLSLLAMRQGEQDVRGGTLELAGVLLAAAVARLALPDARAGLLASRRRLADVAAFAALGIGLLVAGLFFPVPV